jgi:hypothetical protein
MFQSEGIHCKVQVYVTNTRNVFSMSRYTLQSPDICCKMQTPPYVAKSCNGLQMNEWMNEWKNKSQIPRYVAKYGNMLKILNFRCPGICGKVKTYDTKCCLVRESILKNWICTVHYSPKICEKENNTLLNVFLRRESTTKSVSTVAKQQKI